MRALARAFIAHRTPTRIRIKLAKNPAPRADLEKLKQHLLEHPDVFAVQLNALTTSLIVRCRKGFELTARQRELLGLPIPRATDARSVHRRRARAASDARIDRPSQTLILAHMMKLILAISTRQIAAHLVEWVVDSLIYAASREAQRRHGRQVASDHPCEAKGGSAELILRACA